MSTSFSLRQKPCHLAAPTKDETDPGSILWTELAARKSMIKRKTGRFSEGSPTHLFGLITPKAPLRIILPLKVATSPGSIIQVDHLSAYLVPFLLGSSHRSIGQVILDELVRDPGQVGVVEVFSHPTITKVRGPEEATLSDGGQPGLNLGPTKPSSLFQHFTRIPNRQIRNPRPPRNLRPQHNIIT